jgi:hypothetical protein
MMLLSAELGPAKGSLKETELGSYQIGIVEKDHLAYVIIQDLYDNEPFTSKILNHVIERFHTDFLHLSLNENFEMNDQYKQEVGYLLETMKFPSHLIHEVEAYIDRFQIKTHHICDALLLTDLDDGLVKIFEEPKSSGIVTILLEILSEIPFSRQWIGESELVAKDKLDYTRSHEVWFIQRIGMTDFCLAGRAYYKPESERLRLVSKIEELTDNIHQVLLTDSSWF